MMLVAIQHSSISELCFQATYELELYGRTSSYLLLLSCSLEVQWFRLDYGKGAIYLYSLTPFEDE